MLQFRTPAASPVPGGCDDLLAVSAVIDDAMQPGNFFVAPELALSWSAARAETIAWEVFRGRLVGPAHTRESHAFLAWSAWGNPVAEQQPLLSVKLDVHHRRIHVTRGILCHVHEAFDAGGGVIDSRAAIQWTRELVGTIALAEYANLGDVHDELICLLWQAIVGTSRLPLTSLEAPLPAFALGQLHYLYARDAGDQPITAWDGWLARGLSAACAWRETVKLVEFVLRRIAAADVPRLIRMMTFEPPTLARLLRTMFNEVSLSPYTQFAANAIALMEQAGQQEVLGHLLRQLGRHLTAYDLVTFHHRGANYPDALLLDALLKAFLRYLDGDPEPFLGDDAPAVLRRRALRQGLLLRRQYENHLVPDAPTSPGENARVMPESFPRVPEEQLAQTLSRRRRLFADEPVSELLTGQARRVFAQSMRDLEDAGERAELGIGVFIDRPLGYTKAIGEPDQTPLLAHEAYSPSIMRQRFSELTRLCQQLDVSGGDREMPMEAMTTGLPHQELADCPRPVACLADVRRVADDFVILRTLPAGLSEFLARFDWQPLLARFKLTFLTQHQVRLCAQALDGARQPILLLMDAAGHRRVEMRVDASRGYVTQAAVELPGGGLLVVGVWEETERGLVHRDLRGEPAQVALMNNGSQDR